MSVEEVEISEDGFVCVGTGVYGPNLDGEPGFFWMNWWKLGTDSPRCVLGDFNVVRYPREGLGCVTSLSMVDFSDFIENLNLVDLPLEGGLYTWCSGMDPPSMSRMCVGFGKLEGTFP
jgi:hypothetical protein